MRTKPPEIKWPNGKSFAFTIVDDTDHATVTRVRPVYRLLAECGLRTTKTVWTYPHEGGRFSDTETLQDPGYLAFVRDLKYQGFELAFHGARGISSAAYLVREAMEEFYEKLGFYPRTHINHAQNEDNLYWVFNRLFLWQKILHRIGLKEYNMRGTGHGATPGSPWFWGDLAQKHISYVRGDVCKGINTLAFDHEMPYYEKRFPFVNAWFSGSDGGNFRLFHELISRQNVDQLRAERGLCIVYTHFGVPGFVDESTGKVDASFSDRIRYLSNQDGWFAPACEILDYLSSIKGITVTNSLKRWWRTRNIQASG